MIPQIFEYRRIRQVVDHGEEVDWVEVVGSSEDVGVENFEDGEAFAGFEDLEGPRAR